MLQHICSLQEIRRQMKLTQNRRVEKICRKNKMQVQSWGMGVMGSWVSSPTRRQMSLLHDGPSRATEEEACPSHSLSPRLARHEWRQAYPALADSNKMINEACTALRGENGPHLPWSGLRQVAQGCALACPLVVCLACVSYRAFLHTRLNSSESHLLSSKEQLISLLL